MIRGWLLSFAVILMMGAVSLGAMAISPEEQLSDPKLEQRARDLSSQLRCLVCQNQSIEDSDADLAKDLRREVRRQLLDGKSDALILDNLQETYGSYILLRPPVTPSTYLLWAAPFIFLLLALLLFWQFRASRVHHVPDAQATAPTQTDITQTPPLSGRIILSLVVIITASSLALYSQLGRPELGSLPTKERAAERAEIAQQQTADSQARQQLFAQAMTAAEKKPDSVDAQLSLAFAASQIDNFDVEIAALRRALRLTDEAPAIKAMLAEAFSRDSDGQITLPARALIDEVLAVAPNEPRALFMAGLAAYQDEAFDIAISFWRRLQQTAAEGSLWQDVASRNIGFASDQAGIALDQETLTAITSASQEEQADMIAAMVDGLEARLKDSPDDRRGWQQLVQARRVQQDEDGLYRALQGAASQFETDRDAQLDLLEFLLARQLVETDVAVAEEGLARLSKIDEMALEYLFFAGYFAAQTDQKARALALWQRLYEQLPDGDGFKNELGAKIEALR